MRPVIKIEKDLSDKIFDFLSLFILLTVIPFIFFSWVKLPSIVPSHFNIKGQIDNYGSKNFILIMPLLMLFLYTVFTILIKSPHRYNYPVRITNLNAERQYRLSTKVLRTIKLELLAFIGYLSVGIIDSTIRKEFTVNILFLPIIVIVLFLTTFIYIIKSIKNS